MAQETGIINWLKGDIWDEGRASSGGLAAGILTALTPLRTRAVSGMWVLDTKMKTLNLTFKNKRDTLRDTI